MKSKFKIPFSKITFDKKEEQAVINCMRSKWLALGPKTDEFEKAFARYVGSKFAVFVDSGTSALSLAVAVSDYTLGARIPSLTFVSIAEVLYHHYTRIDFVDINKDTFCVDEQYEDCIPTNFAGVLAKSKGRVIDSCHRIERDDIKNRPNSLWCYSFYATKSISCIHGGMIALNSEKKYKWLLKSRDHGTTRGTKQRYEGKNSFYDIKFHGWRVKGNDLMASIGLEQLKKLSMITKNRNRIVEKYNKNLGYNRVGNYLYPILVKNRKRFIQMMYDKGIQVLIHFPPIHRFSAYKQGVDLPVTDYVCDRIVSLPLFPQMTNKEVDYVSNEVLKTKLLIK